MTQRSQTDHERTEAFRPTCPFCRAPWTDAMLDQLDAITGSPSCSCCAGLSWPIEVEPDPAPPPAAPVGDLCCEACGQAIYRKV